MAWRTRGAPKRLSTDTAEMSATIDWLEKELPDDHWSRPFAPQIKVGSLNYYPDTGTLYYDNQKGLKRQALSAFQAAVKRQQDEIWGGD